MMLTLITFGQVAWEKKGNIDKAIKDCGKALEVNHQVWLDAILYKYRCRAVVKR